jgi:hypothetical protein
VRAAEQAAKGQSGIRQGRSIGTRPGRRLCRRPVRGTDRRLRQAAVRQRRGAEGPGRTGGESTDALQAHRAALETNGIAAAQTDQIITRLTHSIGDALRQAAPARDAFNQLGISVDT